MQPSMQPETPPPEWDIEEWRAALSIHVGTTYVCRECGNLVMVTRGGIGILDLICCGRPMEKVVRDAEESAS